MQVKWLPHTAFRTAALVVGLSAVWLWASTRYAFISAEHGPMENFQVLCLVVSVGLFAVAIRRAQIKSERVFLAGLALLYFTIVLLEFDTRELDWPAANKVLNGPVRNAWLGALWLLAFAGFARDARAVIAYFREWLRRPPGHRLLLAGGLWLGGAAAEKLHFFPSKANNLLLEELFEINATVLMLWTALTTLQYISQRAHAASLASSQTSPANRLQKSSL